MDKRLTGRARDIEGATNGSVERRMGEHWAGMDDLQVIVSAGHSVAAFVPPGVLVAEGRCA